MAKQDEETMIEESCGNVFADIGFADATELLAKARLVHAISEAMRARKMSQAALAKLLDVHQPKISRLLRGMTDGFSTDRLMLILNRLDQDIEIVIRPKPQGESRDARVTVAIVHAV